MIDIISSFLLNIKNAQIINITLKIAAEARETETRDSSYLGDRSKRKPTSSPQ
jgi:hypothetical protein